MAEFPNENYGKSNGHGVYAITRVCPSLVDEYRFQVAGHGIKANGAPILVMSDESAKPSRKNGCRRSRDEMCEERRTSKKRRMHRKKRYLLKLKKDERGACELDFYRRIWSGEELDLDYRIFQTGVPRFYGLVDIENNGEYLKLEDITSDYVRPCIMDIKIGTRTWDPTASKEKAEKARKKYKYQAELGFRISGMIVHEDLKGDPTHCKKEFGFSVTPKTIGNALSRYLSSNPSRRISFDVLTQFIQQLYEILTIQSTQKSVRIFSSSLLLVYESYCPTNDVVNDIVDNADNAANLDNVANVDNIDVCREKSLSLNDSSAPPRVAMIDFGHVFSLDCDCDDGYVFGVRRLIKELEKIQSEYDAVDQKAAVCSTSKLKFCV